MRGWRRYRVRARSLRAGWSGRKCFSPTGRTHRFLRPHEGSEAITRRSNAASNERWPMAPWWRSTTDRDLAKSQPSRRRPRSLVGFLGVRQGQGARLSAPSCGPRAFWHAMRASMRPAAGHRCLAKLVPRSTVCKILQPGRNQAAQGALLPGVPGTPSLRQKMAEVLCVYRKVEVLQAGGRQAEEIRQAGGDRLLRRKAEIQASPRHDVAGFAARAWRPPIDLRA